jgi:hypothetical protein
MTIDPAPILDVSEAVRYLRCSASHLNKLRVTGAFIAQLSPEQVAA